MFKLSFHLRFLKNALGIKLKSVSREIGYRKNKQMVQLRDKKIYLLN